MEKKVTIYDISKKLGVSTATINRALNGKPKVSEETRGLVLRTAELMGFKANKAARSLARKTIKIGFIIDEGIGNFNIEVLEGAKKGCADLIDYNVAGDFQMIYQPNTKQQTINKMLEMADANYDGIVISPYGTIRDYEAVIKELAARNVIVATVISDCNSSKRLFSIRNNGRIAGKMAAEFLSLLVKDKPVAIFTGSKDGIVHKATIEGFQEQMLKTPLDLVSIYENYDDPQIAYHATDMLLREHPDIGGIYIGTANSASVCKKIVELGLAGKIKVIASDIFPEIAEYLESGVIHATIFQEPFNQGRLAFKKLYEHIADGKTFEDEILLKPQLVLASNLELFSMNSSALPIELT